MKSRKIIDLDIEKSPTQFKHNLYIVLLTYDDETQKKVTLHGDELSLILNKKFESVDLKPIYLLGKFSGEFKLKATVKGYVGGYREHVEILTFDEVIGSFNERGYLIDNKKNLLDLVNKIHPKPISIQPIIKTNDSGEEKDNKWIIKPYDPSKFNLKPMSHKKKEHVYNVIKINCHVDANGSFIEYSLFGTDKNEVSGIIRQEDIPYEKLPNHVDDVLNDDDNYEKWLHHILDITTQRGQTNVDHTPPKVDLGPYRPYVQPKGKLVFDEKRHMDFYKEDQEDNLSVFQHLKQMGLFAVNKVADVLFPKQDDALDELDEDPALLIGKSSESHSKSPSKSHKI